MWQTAKDIATAALAYVVSGFAWCVRVIRALPGLTAFCVGVAVALGGVYAVNKTAKAVMSPFSLAQMQTGGVPVTVPKVTQPTTPDLVGIFLGEPEAAPKPAVKPKAKTVKRAKPKRVVKVRHEPRQNDLIFDIFSR
jgi:hypothetical protein